MVSKKKSQGIRRKKKKKKKKNPTCPRSQSIHKSSNRHSPPPNHQREHFRGKNPINRSNTQRKEGNKEADGEESEVGHWFLCFFVFCCFVLFCFFLFCFVLFLGEVRRNRKEERKGRKRKTKNKNKNLAKKQQQTKDGQTSSPRWTNTRNLFFHIFPYIKEEGKYIIL